MTTHAALLSRMSSPEHCNCRSPAVSQWLRGTHSTAQNRSKRTDSICEDWLVRQVADTLKSEANKRKSLVPSAVFQTECSANTAGKSPTTSRPDMWRRLYEKPRDEDLLNVPSSTAKCEEAKWTRQDLNLHLRGLCLGRDPRRVSLTPPAHPERWDMPICGCDNLLVRRMIRRDFTVQ